MSISRRQFIVGTAAGLILPSYYDKVLAYWENHGEPMIEIPPEPRIVLVACDRGGGELELNLGDPYEQPPEMTVREYARRYCGSEEEYLEYCGEDEEIDLDAPMDELCIIEAWARSESPNARAFHLLEGLDLGPELAGANAVGEIRFIDGACPGNDYLGVEAPGMVDISLLQKRLNELRTGIVISVG